MPRLGTPGNPVGNRISRLNENLSILGGSRQKLGTEVDGQLATIKQNRALAHQMGMSRKAAASAGGNSSFMQVLPKWYDPTMFWELSNLPWDIQNSDHRKKLHKWMRTYYRMHSLIPILIDIFTRFPLIGIELTSKDLKLTEFYTDLFMDTLDYEDFLVRLGREYWTVGEAFPLGSFDDIVGAWEHEELIPAEDIEIKNFPLLGSTQFEIKPPDYLIELANTRKPMEEYKLLEKNFADLIPLLKQKKNIPVSNELMKQVAFKVNDWDDHGTPILMRSLRTLMHEEKLMNAQDSIAERLYAPLILAKLGVQDVGDGMPWIPSHEELEALRDDFDVALNSDFRLLVHHFGLDITSVFGRESMPRLDSDFDRVDATLMRAFGINPQLLQGGVANVPYASSALQAEFLNQILKTYQGYLKKHYKERALVVAEAQEHYDYEKRGDTRIPIMEEVVEVDEDDTVRIVKKHKLLIPDMNMKVLDLRDEATQRQFLAQLKSVGVPVSDTTFMVGMPTTFEDELEKSTEEAIQKTVAQQEGKVKLYKILRIKGEPIPPALAQEVGGLVEGQPGAAGLGGPSGVGVDVPPGGDQFMMPSEPGGPPGEIPSPLGLGPDGSAPGAPPPAGPITGPAGTVPGVSNERTPLSKVASLDEIDKKLAQIEKEQFKLKQMKLSLDEGRVEIDGEIIIKKPMARRKVSHALVDKDRLDNDKEV